MSLFSRSFKRGIHPLEGKELAKDSAIRTLEPEGIMVFPLSQHIGAPAKPVVAVGDRVLKGQLIAEAGGFISAPVYSSVSGTVKKIEPRQVVNGSKVDCIVIENDGENETDSVFGTETKLESLTPDDIIDRIKQAGIVGLGGAGFPTSVKLQPKNKMDIDTLIVNGSECEPFLTSDYRLMLERGEYIIKGIEAALLLLPNAKAVIGIEDNKPDAIAHMQSLCEGHNRISVKQLRTKYPQGSERQLIYTVTGRRINSRMLPADKSVVVINTASCFAIYEAVYLNMPLIHKVMTITGDVNKPCNLDVPLGVSHAYVLEKAGGAKDSVVKFISGGPMMGMAMSTLEVPVVKTSSSILAFSHDEVAEEEGTACIHCGRCRTVCPQTLVPQLMGKAVKSKDWEYFEKLGGMECIECGCCTYGCPAKIPLTQRFKLGKLRVREMNAKKKESN